MRRQIKPMYTVRFADLPVPPSRRTLPFFCFFSSLPLLQTLAPVDLAVIRARQAFAAGPDVRLELALALRVDEAVVEAEVVLDEGVCVEE